MKQCGKLFIPLTSEKKNKPPSQLDTVNKGQLQPLTTVHQVKGL